MIAGSLLDELISAVVMGGAFVLFMAWAVWSDKRARNRNDNHNDNHSDKER